MVPLAVGARLRCALNAAPPRFQKELWDEGTPEASPYYGQITGQITKSLFMHTPQVLAGRTIVKMFNDFARRDARDLKARDFKMRNSIKLKTLGGLLLLGAVPAIAPLSVPAPLLSAAYAQDAPTIGVVDGVLINEKFTKLTTALDAIDKRKTTLRGQLDARVFMTEADTKRFDELIVKATLTPAETTELAKLVENGTKRRTDYNALLAKATRSDEENKSIKDIEAETQRTATTFQAILDQVDQAVTKQELDTEEQYRSQIIKVVEDVAKEKNLVVVVGKQAVAWNSATVEITDEVLKRLNKA